MGLIRGALFFFVAILLLISLVFGSLFLTMSLSLSYDSVSQNVHSIFKNNSQYDLESSLGGNFNKSLVYCQSVEEGSYNFSLEFYPNVEIPCDVVVEGVDSVFDYSINKFVEDNYYKNYNCDYFDCFESTKSPMFLISEKSQNYWSGKFYFTLFISFILFGLLLLFAENRLNASILFGFLISVSALPLLKVDLFLSPILNFLISLLSSSEGVSFLIEDFSSLFFSKAISTFLIVFGFGLLIVLTGVILKIWGWSFTLSKWFRKDENDSKVRNSKEGLKEKINSLEKKVSKDEKEVKKLKK